MKVKELIKELEKLDQDKEILCTHYSDILDCCSADDPQISTETVIKYKYKTGEVGYESTISNWRPSEPKHTNIEQVEVYIIE
jgi:hypothetical protein